MACVFATTASPARNRKSDAVSCSESTSSRSRSRRAGGATSPSRPQQQRGRRDNNNNEGEEEEEGGGGDGAKNNDTSDTSEGEEEEEGEGEGDDPDDDEGANCCIIVNNTKFDTETEARIVKRLRHRPKCRHLSLYANEISSLRALCEAGLKNHVSLESLNLGRNNIDDAGLETLVNSLSSPDAKARIRRIYLGGNKIATLAALERFLLTDVCVLERVELYNNAISNVDGLAESLRRNRTLKYISLDNNRIGSLRELSEALRVNVTVEEVWIRGNPGFEEDEAGREAFLAALRFHKVENLTRYPARSCAAWVLSRAEKSPKPLRDLLYDPRDGTKFVFIGVCTWMFFFIFVLNGSKLTLVFSPFLVARSGVRSCLFRIGSKHQGNNVGKT